MQQVTRHGGIMASGAGSRMAELGASKPMVIVGGRPLINYALAGFLCAGVTNVAVTVRSKDRALRRHLARISRSRVFDTVDVLTVESEQGACAAIHALVEHAGDVPQLLSAADVVTDPADYGLLAMYGGEHEPGYLFSWLAGACVFPEDPGRTDLPDDLPDEKWLNFCAPNDLAVGQVLVRSCGAAEPRDLAKFAGFRWLDSTARKTLKTKPSYSVYDSLPSGVRLPISESQLSRELSDQHHAAETFLRPVNVNTPHDVLVAQKVMRHWMPERPASTAREVFFGLGGHRQHGGRHLAIRQPTLG